MVVCPKTAHMLTLLGAEHCGCRLMHVVQEGSLASKLLDSLPGALVVFAVPQRVRSATVQDPDADQRVR